MSMNNKRDRRGQFRGRGSYGNHSRRRDDSGSRERNRKHPAHLRGRDIGLYYAQRSRSNREENNKRPLGTVLLSEQKKNQIQSILTSTEYKKFVSLNSDNYDHVKDSAFKRNFLRIIGQSIEDNLSNASVSLTRNEKADEMLYEQHISKQKDPKYVKMIAQRQKLPSFEMKSEILKIIDSNQVVVISGETGCGKTTQVAQFILDDFIENKRGSLCKIICTQPRRISAVSVADRVADERCEKLGNSVGYHIRLENRLPRDRGSVVFCTTGVVLKQMETDPSLSTVSHLILDEIHERDVMSDFILALIKQVLTKRNDLKVILMSATLNSEKFSRYYNNSPHLNIPGFTYPVTEYYLEDVIERTNFVFEEDNRLNSKSKRGREKIEKQISFIDFIEPHVRLLEAERKYSRRVCIQLRNPKSEETNVELILALLIDICNKEKDQGAILVFLTGFSEISTLIQLIQESGQFPRNKYLVFPLHSLMPTIEQKQIFERPPTGVRKIVIATNIAETSITIDDVVFVIDCGKIKISNFDVETNSQTLAPEWVSLANASQRKGRAGRVQPGICFHLFTRAREMTLEQYQKPEILRKRLEDVILTAKVLQLGKVEAFFEKLLDAPDPAGVVLSLSLLKQMNALTDDEILTPLGYHLAKLPMAPQMGKMILFGAMFSCLDPILSIAAALDFKDPFQLPLGKEIEVAKRKLELANGVKSDHLLFHEALVQFERCGHDKGGFCWHYFLSSHTLKMLQDMKKQFMEYLVEMNFVPNADHKSEECNRNSSNVSLVKAIICAGLYPNVAISKIRGKAPTFTVDTSKRLKFHPKSVLERERYFESNLLVYYKKIKSSKEFIHDATLIYPLSVIFFGDKFRQEMDNGHSLIVIGDHLKFKCTESTTAIIKELRDRFNWFLEYKISHPGPVVWKENEETKILEVIMELITCEDMDENDLDAYNDYD